MTDRPIVPRFIGIDRGAAAADVDGMTVHLNASGLIAPFATVLVAHECIRERALQDVRWGESNHPDLPPGVAHPCAFFGLPVADAARLHCETAFRVGSGSHAHILVEEVCEAIEAANDPVHLRAELVQVAASAMKWIEAIDRRGGFGGQAGRVIAVDELATKENTHG